MPESTLYWIIAAIIVVLLILIILSVIASRRRREAEAAETRLERRGITADTAGEQAAAPAAPTRLSRLDEVAAEKDARPAAAVKPAGGPAASDTAAADRETDESVAGVAGGAGVTVDQQGAPSTEATAETHRRDAAAPTTRGTLRPAAAAPSTAREADTVGLGAAGVAGGSGVTLDEQTPAADVPATPASPSPVTETTAPAAPATEALQHRSHLTPAPEHVHGTVPADEVAAVARNRLLDIDIVFGEQKTLRQVHGTVGRRRVTGYEIHHGQVVDSAEQSWIDADGAGEGAVRGAIRGTHWHGLLANNDFRRDLLISVAAAAGASGFRPAPDTDVDAIRQAQVDLIADLLTTHLDMDAVAQIISGPPAAMPTIVHRLVGS